MGLGELLGGCAARCVRAPEEREIRRWRLWEGVTRWWEEVRWVHAGLMVKVGLEGGRLIDGDVVRIEKAYAVCL